MDQDDDAPWLEGIDFDDDGLALPRCQIYLLAFPRSQKRQEEALRIWLVESFIISEGRLPTSSELNGAIEDCRRYIRSGFWAKDVKDA